MYLEYTLKDINLIYSVGLRMLAMGSYKCLSIVELNGKEERWTGDNSSVRDDIGSCLANYHF
jgi:hypothetical protein